MVLKRKQKIKGEKTYYKLLVAHSYSSISNSRVKDKVTLSKRKNENETQDAGPMGKHHVGKYSTFKRFCAP